MKEKKQRTGLIIIGLFLIPVLLVVIKLVSTDPYKMQSPSLDLKGVAEASFSYAQRIIIQHPDGSTAEVIPWANSEEDRIYPKMTLLLGGYAYEFYGEISAEKIRLDELKGYYFSDRFYNYLYSFNGLPGEEWLIRIPDKGKAPTAADFDCCEVFRSLENPEKTLCMP